jgi:hypothetical protein
MMRAHRLKSWPAFFAAVKRGDKTCELRRDDRDYRIGDYLLLLEFDPAAGALKGPSLVRRISHILTAADAPRGLLDGFVLLSVAEAGLFEESALRGGDGRHAVEWITPGEAAS